MYTPRKSRRIPLVLPNISGVPRPRRGRSHPPEASVLSPAAFPRCLSRGELVVIPRIAESEVCTVGFDDYKTVLPTPTSFEKSDTCTAVLYNCFQRVLWKCYVSSGTFMQNYPCLINNANRVFQITVVNCMLVYSFIFAMKIVDDTAFARWTKGLFAPLAVWELQACETSIPTVLLIIAYSLTDFLKLRLVLMLTCVVFILFALNSDGIQIDMILYNLVMLMINGKQAAILIYGQRLIKFSTELEQVYSNLFQQYMTRAQFSNLAYISLLRREDAGSIILKEDDLVTSLIIIIKGVVEVRRKGKVINVIYPDEFLESVPWVQSDLDPDNIRLKVSYRAATDIVYIKFTREMLTETCKDEPLHSAILAVLRIKVAELWLRRVERKVKMSGYYRISRKNSEMDLFRETDGDVPPIEIKAQDEWFFTKNDRNTPEIRFLDKSQSTARLQGTARNHRKFRVSEPRSSGEGLLWLKKQREQNRHCQKPAEYESKTPDRENPPADFQKPLARRRDHRQTSYSTPVAPCYRSTAQGYPPRHPG